MLSFTDILILGKEHRRDPERATRELHARAAAASAVVRARTGHITRVLALEAPMPDRASGSPLVRSLLLDLGVPSDHIHIETSTYSTRAEAILARHLAAGPMLVLTHSYHLDRARRIFAESGPSQFSVHTPESFHKLASPQERTLIAAGTPTVATLAQEARQERIFGLLATLIRPLPRLVRDNAETWAGWRLRGSGLQQGHRRG